MRIIVMLYACCAVIVLIVISTMITLVSMALTKAKEEDGHCDEM